MHIVEKKIEKNRQILHWLQIVLRLSFVVNVIVKVVKITHCQKKAKFYTDTYVVWVIFCCEFVYCEYNYNISIIRVLKTVKKRTYMTMLTKLNDIIRFFFFFDFFVCEIRKKLVIFDVNLISDWNNTNEVLKY